MSVTNDIQNRFLKLLEDGKEHSIGEITNIVIDENIITPERKAMVRSAVVYLRKKNPRIIMLERGKYRMKPEYDTTDKIISEDQSTDHTEKTTSFLDIEEIDEMDKAIKTFRKRIAWHNKRLSWMYISMSELEKVKKDFIEMTQIAEDILRLRDEQRMG